MRTCKHFFLLILLFGSVSCSSHRFSSSDTQWFYAVDPAGQSLLEQFAPVFVVNDPASAYNRIGKPTVEFDEDGENVFVSPDGSVVYAQVQSWKSASQTYRNLIYRIHFPQLPYSISPYHSGAGKNSGLLFVITIDEENTPLLLTTVHTCGCYLAIIPFSSLPESAFPSGWDLQAQSVYGETLPGRLEQFSPDSGEKLVIHLKAGSHRVSDVDVVRFTAEQKRHDERMELLPLADLWKLPSEKGPISFFETEGPRKGYVKGSVTHLERLLVSWWAFDWYVGEDKAYGPAEKTGTAFYTTLSPWRREESDMWNFERFLRYWRWKL